MRGKFRSSFLEATSVSFLLAIQVEMHSGQLNI